MNTLTDEWNALRGKAKVGICLAFSDTPRTPAENIIIEEFLRKTLPLTAELDSDGEIEFFSFDSGTSYLDPMFPPVNQVAIDKLVIGKETGATDYAKAFSAVRNYYDLFPAHQNAGIFKPIRRPNSSEVASSDIPVYMVFLTNGDPASDREAELMLNEVSSVPIFWKFFSIGPQPVKFLQHLDDLTYRFTNNADYKYLGDDPNLLKEDALRSYLLDEFPAWLREAHDTGILIDKQ